MLNGGRSDWRVDSQTKLKTKPKTNSDAFWGRVKYTHKAIIIVRFVSHGIESISTGNTVTVASTQDWMAGLVRLVGW